MGGVISDIAFPVPDRNLSRDELECHPGLTWLETENGFRIPAVWVDHPDAEYTIICELRLDFFFSFQPPPPPHCFAFLSLAALSSSVFFKAPRPFVFFLRFFSSFLCTHTKDSSDFSVESFHLIPCNNNCLPIGLCFRISL
jgi:hypothetical protein